LADILSQNEIDGLLRALTSGKDTAVAEEPVEEPSDEVRPYNFRTANKFSKEQIRMLHFIYENFAGRLGTFLSGTLRANCEAEVISVEEQTFLEFNNSLPTPAFLAMFTMPPLAGSSMLELSPGVSFEIISRLFGGKGQAEPETNKPFTDIEVAILHRIVQQMLGVMNDSWERITKVNAKLDRIETSSQFAQIVAANEPIVIITMNVRIGDVSDLVNLCVPHVAIQPIAKQLATATWYNERTANIDKDEMDISEINPRINHTEVTMHARFNDTEATILDVINLRVGDVIRVDHPANDDITVYVEHIPKFKAKIGAHGKRMAVLIGEVLEEELSDG
jgi:flagellar motor switch protein FliM